MADHVTHTQHYRKEREKKKKETTGGLRLYIHLDFLQCVVAHSRVYVCLKCRTLFQICSGAEMCGQTGVLMRQDPPLVTVVRVCITIRRTTLRVPFDII